MARVEYQQCLPLDLLAQGLRALVATRPDALVIGAYCSGTVPSIIIPEIRAATEARMPVFSIRQTMTGEWTRPGLCDVVIPGKYEAESDAIVAGLIPLQRGVTQLGEVMDGLQEICANHQSYELRAYFAQERFCKPQWISRTAEIQGK